MRQPLRVMNTPELKASLNMAIDEAVLLGVMDGSSPSTLRLYSFSPPAVTIGRFQRLPEELRRRAETHGLAVVRRPTGGRAVVHGSDLSYSVVAPVDHPVLGGSIKETYRKVCERLVSALSALGVTVSFTPSGRTEKYERSESCFDTSVLYELKSGPDKIAGNAQTRRGGVFLQQGTISLGTPPLAYELLFGEGAKTPKDLSALAERSVGYSQLAESILLAFGVEGLCCGLTSDETGVLGQLERMYESTGWNQFGENHCVIKSYMD